LQAKRTSEIWLCARFESVNENIGVNENIADQHLERVLVLRGG